MRSLLILRSQCHHPLIPVEFSAGRMTVCLPVKPEHGGSYFSQIRVKAYSAIFLVVLAPRMSSHLLKCRSISIHLEG